MREIRTLGLMRRGLETGYGNAIGALPEETGSNRSAKPKGTAPVLDPTRGCKSPTEKEKATPF